MELAVRFIDLAVIRTDGGTQVREALNEEWVQEFVDLYSDGAEVDPIIVVRDADGAHWLVDGFHRVEAQRRRNTSMVSARVHDGTLGDARLLAARCNMNGLPRTAGDKKRAILMADTEARKLGRAMGVRELARHCGVNCAYVSRVLGGGVDKSTGRSPCSSSSATQAAVRVLHARVDAALAANPERTADDIAAELGCGPRVVYHRRKALGMPLSVAAAAKVRFKDLRARVALAVGECPEKANAVIARECETSPETVAKIRAELGYAPSDARGKRPPKAPPAEPPPSAPTRKSAPDARDGATVTYLPRRISDARTAVMQAVERLSPEERPLAAADLANRWPEAFAVAAAPTQSEAR